MNSYFIRGEHYLQKLKSAYQFRPVVKSGRTSESDCPPLLKSLRDRRKTTPQIQAEENTDRLDPVSVNTVKGRLREAVSLDGWQKALALDR